METLGLKQASHSTRHLCHKTNALPFAITAAIFTICFAPLTSAAEAGATTKEQAKVRRSGLLEEVVVTAQKREEDVSSVPIAIAAFSGEQLESLGIEEPNDLTALAPSLQMTESVGFSVVYLRGVGTDAFLMADPSVALYQDDVYMPHSFGASQKFGKVERAEILKGPQGTIFGRNATGGAINVHTAKPNPEEFEGSVQVDYSNYDKKSGKAFLNIPIVENLAISLSAHATEHDSYYDARQGVSATNPNGEQVPGHDSSGVQVKLFIEPTEWMEVLLSAQSSEEEDPGSLLGTNTEPSQLGQITMVEQQSGREDVRISGLANRTTDIEVISANIKMYFETFDTKIIASKQKVFGTNQIDIDGSEASLVGFTVDQSLADIDQLEIQFSSNENSWKSESISWIFGFYGYQGSAGLTGRAIVADTDLDEGLLLGQQLPVDVLGIANDLGVSDLISLPTGKVIFDGYLDTDSVAAFAQLTYRFNESFAITLGGRYTDEEREETDSRSYTAGENGSRDTLINDARTDEILVTREFTPRIALEYTPNDQMLIYATWQTAVKSATYNVINLIDDIESVDQEEIEAYEIGFKATWLDGLLQVNAAVFDYVITNPQAQYFSLQAGGAIGFESAQEATTQGIDFDIKAGILPELLGDVVLTVSGAYIDAVFTSFSDCTGYAEDTGLYSENLNCTGSKVPRAPELSGRIGLNKVFYFGDSTIELAGDAYFNDGYFFESNNRSSTEQAAYTLLNAHGTYRHEELGIAVTGYIRNIEDEEYFLSSFGTDFGNLIHLATPRTYGIKLSYSF